MKREIKVTVPYVIIPEKMVTSAIKLCRKMLYHGTGVSIEKLCVIYGADAEPI
jgi:hypothetical protein